MISDDRLAALADMFHLMGDPTRLAILLACLEAPRAVGDLAATTGASPSLVSHHLRLLRAARIVRAERRGRQVFYAAADAHIRTVLRDMVAHAGEPQAVDAGVPQAGKARPKPATRRTKAARKVA